MADSSIFIKRVAALKRKMSVMAMRELCVWHNEVFAGSRYLLTANTRQDRECIENRMLAAFLIQSTNEPGVVAPEDAERVTEKALETLTRPILKADALSLSKKRASWAVLFHRSNLAIMERKELVAYATVLGMDVTRLSDNEIRTVLYEWYVADTSELPRMKVNSSVRPSSQIEGKMTLRELVMKYPTMGWPEFQEAFGDLLPKTTRTSFYHTRSMVRKLMSEEFGVELPRLRAGVRLKRKLTRAAKYAAHIKNYPKSTGAVRVLNKEEVAKARDHFNARLMFEDTEDIHSVPQIPTIYEEHKEDSRPTQTDDVTVDRNDDGIWVF